MKAKHHLSLLLLCAAVSSQGADLIIELASPPTGGNIEILLFNSASTFRQLRDPVKKMSRPANGTQQFTITDIAPGEYAPVVYHDLNNNRELDKNFMGIPQEPVGFANSYRPKGPPFYKNATITLTDETPRTVSVDLRAPMGDRGQLGVGLGVIVNSSPYRNSDGATFLPIPAITYTGERLQLFGPQAQYALIECGPFKFAATARYRSGAYKEEDSPALNGMGDRNGTLMGGASLQAELPAGLKTQLTFAHDLLNQIGGSELSLFLDRSFEIGSVRLTPDAGLNWTAARLANHDYGVPATQTAPGRPAYDTGDTLSFETGLNLLAELSDNWLLVARLGVEFLPSDVTDSPIVSEDHLFKGFLAINYIF